MGLRSAIRRWRNPYHALNDLDRKLERYLDYDGGYYVELGANDGVNQTNTLYFERKRNWRGVLIEPSPNRFLECVANRGARNAVFCAACVPDDYPDRFVEMEYANLMSVSRSLGSDLPDQAEHLEKGEQFLQGGERRFVYGALARRLTEILDEAKAPEVIDLLSLDVEGAEMAVLGGLDLSRYSFRYMLIETRSPDVIAQRLGAYGYRRVDALSHHDILFAGPSAELQGSR